MLCLTEHHFKEQEIESLAIEHYTVSAKFCRHNLKQGGTCIIVHESLTFTNIDLQEFCIEEDIEISAAKITSLSTMILVICIYRSPTGNFAHFIKRIDNILNHFRKPDCEIIICADKYRLS